MSNRGYLKSATQHIHGQAEQTWLSGHGFANLSTYRGWLGAMLKIHQTHGLQAAGILDGQCDPALEQDRLDALQRDLDTAQAIAVPASRRSESWAWGVQYVLNGSALGACVLLKTGGVAPAWPSQYLRTMQGFAQSGGLKRFFDMLDGRELDLAEATSGARAAFTLSAGPA